MQTLQEKHLVIMNAIVGYGLWPEDCYFPFAADGSPSADPNGYRNFELLKREVNSLDKDEDFELEDARKLFLRLRDNGNNVRQTLIKKTSVVVQVAPSPVDPVTNDPMPWGDEPALAKITNLEVATRKETVRMFLQNPSLLQKFNDRLAWLQRMDRHQWDDPGVVDSKPAPVATAQQARALVAKLTIRDISSSHSSTGGGKWDQLLKAQKRLHNYIDGLVRQRVDDSKIAVLVQNEIDSLTSSSVR